MAKVIKAPFKPGEIFDLPLKVLAPRAGETDQAAEANYRRRTSTETLEELAQSIHELGQLQPVLVWWTGEGWALGAGYRRVLAMALEAERYGFKQVECKAVEREKAALVRLAENLQREDPSSYDTSEYLFRLSTGQIDGVKHTPTEIGQHLGKSARHVANLIRFFRETPEYVRAAWRNDSAGRFTFSRLNELATLAARPWSVATVSRAGW
jgi:ParB/RepB/Spo0J family partition protein